MSELPPPPGDGPRMAGSTPPPSGPAPQPPMQAQPPPPGWPAGGAAPGDPGSSADGQLPPGSKPIGHEGVVPPGSVLTWELGDAVGRAWDLFARDWAKWVGAVVLLLGVALVAFVPLVVVAIRADSAGSDPSGAAVATTIVVGLVGIVASVLLAFGLQRTAVAATRGEPVELRSFVSPDRLLPFIGAQLLVALGTMVGLVLCLLPGIAFSVLCMWVPMLVLDGYGPAASIRMSIAMTRQRWADALVLIVVAWVLSTIGSLALFVGLVVAWPVTMLVQAVVYRVVLARTDFAGVA